MTRRKTFVTLTCEKCGTVFQRELKQYNDAVRKGHITSRCSRACGGYHGNLAYREIVQKGLDEGLTPYRIAIRYRMCRTTVYAWAQKIRSEQVERLTTDGAGSELLVREV